METINPKTSASNREPDAVRAQVAAILAKGVRRLLEGTRPETHEDEGVARPIRRPLRPPLTAADPKKPLGGHQR
jgi:hypothetical protein